MTESTYDFETGIYRPPSEGGAASLLLRLTRNCPWNHCTFCAMYKHEKFEFRKPDEIKHDIDIMKSVKDELTAISETQNTKGLLTQNAVTAFFNKHQDLYFHQGISMLINWFAVGGRTVFLQDADSLVMKADQMIDVLTHLKKTFPSIERITTYARSRTISRKPLDDLVRIKKAGLDRVHIGLESGDPEILKTIKKGATPEDHVKGGQKALQAGFQVSEYWMPGLGGDEKSMDHAKNTADVLSRINPHYIRSRPFTARPGSPLYEQFLKSGKVRMEPIDQLMEIRTMIENLEVTSKVCFDHAGNYWKSSSGGYLFSHDYEGYQFPEEKSRLVELIDSGIRNYRPKSTT